MKLAKRVVRYRISVLVVALLLLVPAVLGMARTRVNYDLLDYLPSDMDTVVGQNELLSDFGKGAFSILILEDMPDKDVDALLDQIRELPHVDTVVWYSTLADLRIPKELLPEKIWKAFNTDHSTAAAVFFDSATSADETMDAVRAIRKTAGKQCFVSGMSALVTDLKDLCEKEEPVYVGLAVVCALIAMMIFLDSWLVPLVFMASIGIMILFNLGTNVFFGEISYITKALSAVLQLAVTMDYSIFLWNSYNEQLAALGELKAAKKSKEEAMARAIKETFVSVLGSSVTTIAGFIALCFMSFTLGADLGIVMAKGVLLGVIGSVTVLPCMILVLDQPLRKSRHRTLLPNMHRFSVGANRVYPVFLILFLVLLLPATLGYIKTNQEVYYDMGDCLPENIEYVAAKRKLTDEFDIASTHMLLVRADLPAKEVKSMMDEMEAVDGVKYVLGIESLTGGMLPEEIIPDRVRELTRSDRWKLLMISSEYKVASDLVNEQVNELDGILKKYDPEGLLIGEAPCMKDMIETTGHDFKVVNAVSILAIFVIIALVEQSLLLPVILIVVIELAIFINLGLPHYLGQSLPFIAPICISTIQLGATVDYAILMTTRYKAERLGGRGRKEAVIKALESSMPSVIVSGLGLFAATFGVAVYSNIDIIQSMCVLLARGALISVGCVILILPAMLMLFDGAIWAVTIKHGRKIK